MQSDLSIHELVERTYEQRIRMYSYPFNDSLQVRMIGITVT